MSVGISINTEHEIHITIKIQSLNVKKVSSFTGWIAFSTGLILFNKYLLVKSFPFPIVLTCWHMVFASIATAVLKSLGRIEVPAITWGTYLARVFPLAILLSISLVFSNEAYRYLSVSTIQMVKASNCIIVLMLSFLFKLRKPTIRLICVIAVVSFGVGLASGTALDVNTVGLTLQLIAVCSEGSRLVGIQLLMASWKLTPLASLYVYAPFCALILYAISLVQGELEMAITVLSAEHILLLLMNASVAFLLNIFLVWLISETSSLTVTVGGAVKDSLLIYLSHLIFGSQVTATQIIGFTIAICGTTYYSFLPLDTPQDEQSTEKM